MECLMRRFKQILSDCHKPDAEESVHRLVEILSGSNESSHIHTAEAPSLKLRYMVEDYEEFIDQQLPEKT
jgi:hypothetical protein